MIIIVTKLDSVALVINAFTDFALENKALGLLLILMFYTTSVALMVPVSLFIITIYARCGDIIGGTYGFFIAIILVYLCTVAGCTLAFLLSRFIFKENLKLVFDSAKTRAILNAFKDKGFKLVALFRLSTLLPYELMNYALGASNIGLKDYVKGCIGLLPSHLLYAFIAFFASSLKIALQNQESAIELIVILSIGAVLGNIIAIYFAILAIREVNLILQEAQPDIENVKSYFYLLA